MQVTLTLTPEGHLVLPKAILHTQQWKAGMQLTLIETNNGFLLKPQKNVKKTTVEEVAGCLRYSGTPKTLEDMEAAIATGVKEHS